MLSDIFFWCKYIYKFIHIHCMLQLFTMKCRLCTHHVHYLFKSTPSNMSINLDIDVVDVQRAHLILINNYYYDCCKIVRHAILIYETNQKFMAFFYDGKSKKKFLNTVRTFSNEDRFDKRWRTCNLVGWLAQKLCKILLVETMHGACFEYLMEFVKSAPNIVWTMQCFDYAFYSSQIFLCSRN